MLLLVNYRPGTSTAGAARTTRNCWLDPLPPVSADELLHASGTTPARTLKQLLIVRTEGNPFFLEESVRTLVETGVLVGMPGAYHLAQVVPSIQVPATVQAVLAAHRPAAAGEKRLPGRPQSLVWRCPSRCCRLSPTCPRRRSTEAWGSFEAAEFLYETRLFPEHAYTFNTP